MASSAKGGLLGLFNLNDFTALVVAALGAGTVRKLGFVAVGALAEGERGKVIVSATESRALLGMSPFRICHDLLPFNFGAVAKRPRTQSRPWGATAICLSSRRVRPSVGPAYSGRNC